MKRNFIQRYWPVFVVIVAGLCLAVAFRPFKYFSHQPAYSKPPAMIQQIDARGKAQQTQLNIQLSSRARYRFFLSPDKKQLQIRFKNTLYVMHQPLVHVAPSAVKQVTLKRKGRDTDVLIELLPNTTILHNEWQSEPRQLQVTLRSPRHHYFVPPKPKPKKSLSDVAKTRQQYRRALRLLKRGKVEAAEKALNKILSTQPTFTPARLSLAEIYSKTGHIDTSVSILNRGVKLQPKTNAYWMPLGVSYEKLNRTDDAIHAYQRALAQPNLSPNQKTQIHQRLQVLENLRR
jgi:predicted Zn-dependent protease